MRAAAEELALTHGAVSRRVSKLSQDLGIRLVQPKGRGVSLTPAGAKMAESAGRAFALISQTLSSLVEQESAAPIVVSCERSLAMRWLISRLSLFQDLHPEVPIHLSVGGGFLDFAKDGITLAIRRLDFPLPPDWQIDPLFDEAMGPVMKPSMRGVFEAGDYIGLQARTRPNAWADWVNQNPRAAKPKETRMFDHQFLLAEAAANGLGVAICPQIVALDDVKSGRLIAPLGFTPDGSKYGLIYPSKPNLSYSAKTVVDWIKDISKPVDV